MKSFFIRIAGFILIQIILFTIVAVFLDYYVVRNHNIKVFWILSKKNQNYDFAFLGSSRVNYMIDVDKLKIHYGPKLINLGNDGAGTFEVYLIFKKFIENNNKIKKLLIQIDNTTFDLRCYSYPFHEYQFLPYYYRDKTIREAIKENVNSSKLFLWSFIPMSKYIEFKNIYSIYLKVDTDTMNFDMNSGTKLYYQKFSRGRKKIRKELKYFNQDSISYNSFCKILDLAKEKKIEVILYTAPFHSDYLKNYEMPSKHLSNIAKQFKLPYFDFSKEESIRDSIYFADIGHLNKQGTTKFTSLLIDSIEGNANRTQY